jgi:hypothetical protein
LRGRGKIRRIRSVHISGRIARKCLRDKVLTPILTRPATPTSASWNRRRRRPK